MKDMKATYIIKKYYIIYNSGDYLNRLQPLNLWLDSIFDMHVIYDLVLLTILFDLIFLECYVIKSNLWSPHKTNRSSIKKST